jgi:hypothetical protein
LTPELISYTLNGLKGDEARRRTTMETVTLSFTRDQVEAISTALRHRASGQEVYAQGAPHLALDERRRLAAEAKTWRDMAMMLANDCSPAELA